MSELSDELAQRVKGWAENPYAIHKRPPFRAHSFDNDGRFWVVGSTKVSVFGGFFGPEVVADRVAQRINELYQQYAPQPLIKE